MIPAFAGTGLSNPLLCLLFKSSINRTATFLIKFAFLEWTNPLNNNKLYFVYATSDIKEQEIRCRDNIQTLVKIKKEEYPTFTESITAINCNDVNPTTLNKLIRLYDKGLLKPKPDMPKTILDKIIWGVQNSESLIDPNIVNIIL